MADSRKKLIEVALPLDAINAASKAEKDRKVGKPQQVHHWWARRPIVSARAVIFAQLVDDPSSHPERFESLREQEEERERLFAILERLVAWESMNDEAVLASAMAEIEASSPDGRPAILDPFCGGGSIPLEAQRLGLKCLASDLNPVAVLITKALVELPSEFAGTGPIRPTDELTDLSPTALNGLADDIDFYGRRLHTLASEALEDCYPRVQLEGGGNAKPIAWIWARTLACPSPACGQVTPLLSTPWLAKKRRRVWLDPRVSAEHVRFLVRSGEGQPSEDLKVGRGKFKCAFCGELITEKQIRQAGTEALLGRQLVAVVCEAEKGRLYCPADDHQSRSAEVPAPNDVPETELVGKAAMNVGLYGLHTHAALHSPRQLRALDTFASLVATVRDEVISRCREVGFDESDALQYGRAIATYLGLCVSRMADWNNTLCRWESSGEVSQQLYSGQSVPMAWDYSEANPLAESSGSFLAALANLVRSVRALRPGPHPQVDQADAADLADPGEPVVVTTDPPYYANIWYADVADLFYIWLRRALGDDYPDLFHTVLTPKEDEIIASSFRFEGDSESARRFFEDRFGQAFKRLAEYQDRGYPLVLYYAYKQAESSSDPDASVASTGWETMLAGLIDAGLMVTATWPMRTEMSTRAVGRGANALASSIVLACRPRSAEAGVTDRRGLLQALRAELPEALRQMQQGSVTPVDLAQSSIGPGMSVFSRFARVLEPSGEPMRVRTALGLINQVLDEVLAEQEGDFDAETRWAIKWFTQYGFDAGPFGDAETLCKATGTAVDGMQRSGILDSKASKVWLIGREDLLPEWDPAEDDRIPVWEATQYLAKALDEGGEGAAAELLVRLGGLGETARELAYRLYAICEARKWASEAAVYNALAASWPEIKRKATEGPSGQGSLL